MSEAPSTARATTDSVKSVERPNTIVAAPKNDPAKWRRNVPTFSEVKYQEVYPGVDLVYYGNQRELEYDFVLAPGGDSQQIQLSFDGAERLRLDADGNLVVSIAGREIIEHTPIIYQDIEGGRRSVAGGYVLRSNHTVGFKVAAYDHRGRLTIDPSLSYSTYLGGSGDEAGAGIAVDSSGNAYVTGGTLSSNFPTTAGALQTTFGGGDEFGGDAFVSKLNSTGSALVYSTYLGGSGDDNSGGIVLDSSGNAYVTGTTGSINFPTTAGALQTTFGGGQTDAFVSKLNSSGSTLMYSTYLGGSDIEGGRGVAVDSSGNAYVTGFTRSSNFPITPGALQPKSGGDGDVFISKLNSSGSALIYSTYLGGNSDVDDGMAIAVDSSGNAYVSGETESSNFPTTAGAFQTSFGGFVDAFVSKLNSSGSALMYSTYLGGSGFDLGAGIAVDSSGNAYVTGEADSSNFPTTAGALQTTFGGISDAFVSKLNSSGSALIYSTYLGGTGEDIGIGIAADASGNACVAGRTGSSNFPTTAGALQTTFGGGPTGGSSDSDAFVSKLNSTGSALVYSTYLGGNDDDGGAGIALDSSGNAYVTGFTGSINFPTTAGALQTTFGGGSQFGGDAFITKITFCAQPRPKTIANTTAG